MSKNKIANLSVARPTEKRTDIAAAARAFAGERLVRLSVDVPAELRKALKGLSATRERPIRDLVIDALQAQYPEIRRPCNVATPTHSPPGESTPG